MIMHDDAQAQLLEDYCATLAHDSTARPPAGLDPALATVARQLAAATSPEPDSRMLAALREQLLGTGTARPARHRPATPPPITITNTAAPPPATPRPRPPTPLARLTGAFLVILSLAVLVTGLAIFPPVVRKEGAGVNTPRTPEIVAGGPPVECGPAPWPTPASGPTTNPPGVALTATAAIQLTTTATVRPSPTLAPPKPRADYCTPPRADLLTLAQAAEKVRALLGMPDAPLYARYDALSQLENPAVVIERTIPGAAAGIERELFALDAMTGEFVSAYWNSNEARNAPEAPIDEREAIVRAEVFARTQDPNLDLLQRRSVESTNDSFSRTTVTWQLRAGVDGAWLPTSITVGISTITGRVTQFQRSNRTYGGTTTPALDAATAGALVLQQARQDPRAAQVTVREATLQVAAPQTLNNENADFRLIWIVDMENLPQGMTIGTYLPPRWYVDALTGEVIPAKPHG